MGSEAIFLSGGTEGTQEQNSTNQRKSTGNIIKQQVEVNKCLNLRSNLTLLRKTWEQDTITIAL